MAFVNERIPEADKQRIDFSKIKDPVSNRPIYTHGEWTIDRERDIALMSLGGGGPTYPNFFVLYWKGRVIHAQLVHKLKGSSKTNDLEVTWRLVFLGQVADVSEPEMIEVLKEALQVYGYGSMRWRDTVKGVHFDFDGKHLKNKI